MSLDDIESEIKSFSTPDVEEELKQLSLALHSNPELGWKEYEASKLLANWLEGKGFAVERQFKGLDTAFLATYGSGSPVVCYMSEYDALPSIASPPPPPPYTHLRARA